MQVLRERPPLFDEIDAAFDVADKPVIFAFGDTIYNPCGVVITRELQAHEFVHSVRQGQDVEAWWRRYIAEPAFRLDEEIPAHQTEYVTFCKDNPNGRNRNARRLMLNAIATKLAAPLYGNLITFEKARALLKAAHSSI